MFDPSYRCTSCITLIEFELGVYIRVMGFIDLMSLLWIFRTLSEKSRLLAEKRIWIVSCLSLFINTHFSANLFLFILVGIT